MVRNREILSGKCTGCAFLLGSDSSSECKISSGEQQRASRSGMQYSLLTICTITKVIMPDGIAAHSSSKLREHQNHSCWSNKYVKQIWGQTNMGPNKYGKFPIYAAQHENESHQSPYSRVVAATWQHCCTPWPATGPPICVALGLNPHVRDSQALPSNGPWCQFRGGLTKGNNFRFNYLVLHPRKTKRATLETITTTIILGWLMHTC